MEDLVARLADEKEALETQQDDADIAREAVEVQLQDLTEALEASEVSLQQVEASEVRLRNELEALQDRREAEVKSAANELTKAVAELDSCRRQISVLKDTTAVGTKQAEVDSLLGEKEDLSSALRRARAELESTMLERDTLAERLIEFEQSIAEEVQERVVAERESSLVLDRKLRSVSQRLTEEQERVMNLEVEKKLLSSEVDELGRWKAVYESGHGLQELARSQRKVKEDNRRLGIALEQVTRKLGEAIDSNGVMAQAFERLKRETGKPADFAYPDTELREEMLGDVARLRAQTYELEAQIEALEDEAVRVRRALKNQVS
jgi:chromosome segregation ATPase